MEGPPSEAAAHGFFDFDTGFVAMSQTLAENIKKSLVNHPDVKLTVEPGLPPRRSRRRALA